MEPQAQRFTIIVGQGPPHGDLYEFEQTTYYRVVDTLTGSVVMTFCGTIEASLSTDTGLWEHNRHTGVAAVTISADGRAVIVIHSDGREETVPLPAKPSASPGDSPQKRSSSLDL